MKRPVIFFPISLVLRFGETGLKIVMFLFGFAFKSAAFLVKRLFAVTVGAFIGLLLGKKHIQVKLGGKKR